MRKLVLLLSVLTSLFFTSCSEKEGNQFKISAQIANMPAQNVLLEEISFKNSVLVDSTHSDKAGNFELSGKFTEPALYKLQLGNEYLLIIVDNSNINLKADWNNLKRYSVSGSPGSGSLKSFLDNYASFNKDLIATKMAYDSLKKANAEDSILALVEGHSDQQYEHIVNYIKEYADTTQSAPAAVFAASKLLGSPDEIDYLQKLSASMQKRFESTQLSKDFTDQVAAKAQSMQNEETGPQIGSQAPDFTVTSVRGDKVSLGSFKGKYVLLDFWASWCPPCRAENPNVVAAYNKFKDKNFTILSISLDNKKEKWQEAIKEDQLSWTQASDLKGWESDVAALYGVQAIPTNFLIDPSGKVIATNLRGSRLQKILGEYLLKKPVTAAAATVAPQQ